METRAQQKGYNVGRTLLSSSEGRGRICRDREYKMEARQFLGAHGRWPQSSL